jgi:phosphomevalonate kinase
MAPSRSSSTVISAPGKVFLAGGYLVLDRDYTAIVFGLDARIHVRANGMPTVARFEQPVIHVRSPQFKQSLWRYRYDGQSSGTKIITDISE